MTPMTNPDQSAIEAIRRGERDRFAELVERHQRMVYGIAWSYLGDADLCEDAAQETFIKAFRYLGALRSAEKFPAWLSRIARNVSATLLRRRHNDLANRRRWQTEQPEPVAAPAGDNEDENLKETLGRTIEELPPRHRECLVLFYLEGKSIREVAGILGLSEVAVRGRLHRARGVLRGRLEQQIERGLKGLGPRKGFTAAVMLALPQKPLGWIGLGTGASAIGKAGGWLAGLVPTLLMALWMAAVQGGVMFVMMRFYARLEAANIVDTPENKFRKSILSHNAKMVAMVAAFVALFVVFGVQHFSYAAFYQVLAVYAAWGTYQATKLLRVNRSAFVKGQFLAIVVFFLVFVLMGFFGAPPILFFAGLLVLNLVLMRTNRHAPRRQDYNLFLRFVNGHLGEPEPAVRPAQSLSESQMRAFARFLGEQFLVRDYSIKNSAIMLHLPPVRNNILNSFLCMAWDSSVTIDAAGNCRARLSRSDEKAIRSVTSEPIDPRALEDGLGRVFEFALSLYLAHKEDNAKRLLSTIEDEQIFVTEYGNTKNYKLQMWIAIASAAILMIAFCHPSVWKASYFGFGGSWRAKPVTQSMAEEALGDWIRKSTHSPTPDPELAAMWLAPVHPSMSLVKGLETEYKTLVYNRLKMDLKDGEPGAVESRIVNGLLHPDLLYLAMSTPILTRDELASIGFVPANVRRAFNPALAKLPQKNFNQVAEMWTYTAPTPSRPKLLKSNTVYEGIDIETFAKRLWIFKQFDCLDLIDRDAFAKQIAGYQVTTGFQRPPNWPQIDVNEAAGLFDFGRCSLGETWAALWALETLGRPELADREACIQAILLFYRGKGVFSASDPVHSGIQILGQDADAFYAMEALARFNALGRIPDFETWKFHPVTYPVTIDHKTYPRQVTGLSMWAYAYQERLEPLRTRIDSKK